MLPYFGIVPQFWNFLDRNAPGAAPINAAGRGGDKSALSGTP